MAEVALEIRKVTGKKELARFIDFPFDLYKKSPFWCPPLKFDEFNTLSKDKNPSFDYCEAEYWIAYRGNEPVGRIAGIINYNANKRWDEDLVRFGWIDFVNDEEVSSLLIDTVANWGREKGMTGIQGPLGFTDMDPEGMLVEGFDQLSALSAIYNYPYYPEHMQRMGFEKAVDWVQYTIPVPDQVPEKVDRLAGIVSGKYKLHHFYPKRKKEWLPYARKMFELQNEAFKELYGYAALSDRQMNVYTEQYFGFIRSEFVSMVIDDKDDVIAYGISLPHLTKALQKCRGKLFPFGFVYLLRSMQKNDAIHMYLVGVRPDYQGKGVLAMIFKDLHHQYLRNGIKTTTTHPQLEENFKALSIWKNYEGRINIRRRCWLKKF